MANSRIDQANSKAMLAHLQEVEAGKQQKQNGGQATQAGKPDVKSMLARMQEVEKRKNQKQENRGLIAPGGMVPRTKTAAPVGQARDIGMLAPETAYASYSDLAAQAQKEYDDYLASDEYKVGQQTRMQQYMENHRWDGLIAGLSGGSTVPSAATVRELTDTKAEELKAKAEHYKNLAEQEANQKVMDVALAELESWSDEDKRNLADYVAQRSNTQIANMFGAQQFDTYNLNPIVQKYGVDKVRQMAEVFERQQNENMAKQVEETSRAAVDGGFWNGAGHSAASVGANLIGSMTALPGRVLELQNRTGQFPTLQKYTPYDMPSLYAGTVRGQVAENISGDQYDVLGNKVSDGGGLRQAAAYAYQGLMSSADSLARAALGGGNKIVSLGLAATGSFGQTMSDASARGATPGQAVLLGVINGGLEVATEYLPLDEILKVAKGSPVSGKQLLKNVFKQAAIEVTEEEVSFLGSLLAEAVVLQEKSGYKQKIAEAVAGGATYEDARDKANWDILLEAAETAITSAFSGGISAGVSSGAANINNRAAEKAAQQNPINPDARVELADPTVDFEKETWDLCDRLAKATGRNIKLYQNYGTEEGIDNGYYEDGVIYVNTESADPVAQIISHELTHSVEFAQEYNELSRMVLGRIEAMGGDLKQLRQSKADLYAKNGHALNSQAEIDQEIVAEYVAQNLLTNEQQIMEAARQNRTLIEKIKAWVDKLLGALGNKDAAERAYLTNVQNLYAKALQQTQNATVQSATQTVPAAVQTQGIGMQEQGAAQENAEELADDEAPNWDDPVQVRTWAQNMLSSGQITNEEFNGYIDLAEQLAEEKTGRENFAGDNDRKFSISNISGEKADYGKGVILDTDIFDGVRPRAWGNVLSNYVYNNLAGKELTVYDENGNPETIYLAKGNDRVRKDGAKNSHKVLDKLAGYRGDPIRAQAIVHLSEVLETSRYEKTTDDHSHQWLDENGWIFRKVYLQTKDGKIYEATLNIADGRNQKTLYEVNRIHQIDKKETPASIPSTDNSQRSRYQEPRMGGTQSEVTGEMIADNGKTVKRQYSFAGPGARTANSQTLAEAKALDEAGAANETIRQQTGWFKGMDGKWRFEVDDSTSRINENISNYMTLGELLQDAEIFDAYPDMRDMTVVFQTLPPGVYAQYNRQFDHIDVSYELKDVPEAIRDAVLHEIQHAIQNREGFTGGATVGSWERKIKAGFDSRRGADIRKARETEQELRRVQQEEPEFYRDMMELDAMTPEGPRGEVDWDTLEQITEDPTEWQAFDARRDQLEETYGDMKVWDFMDLLHQQEKAAKNEGRSATELYWDTAGEIEARNVAGRRNLTAEERKNTPPILGDEDTVFAIEREVTPFITGTQNLGAPGGATSTISIIRKILDVKEKNADNTAKNRQFSIGAQSVDRKNVANDLRGILSRGGDVSELRRYIDQLEQGSGNAERSGRNAYQKGASAEQSGEQRIIQAAKRSGISVEEYLRQNWEQYDIDGEWNEDARAALEQERRGRRYSVSETEEQSEQKTAEQIRQEMPTKARNYLQGAQRKLLNELQNKLGVNKFTNREDLQKIVEEIADTYLATGTVEDGKMGELFDRAYAGGIIRDAEFYEQYKEIKNHLRKTAVTISEGDSHDIADFLDFKRRNWGTLRIVKEGGLPVDSAYHELNGMAPELFPESITHPADQLVRMAEVARSIQVSEKNLDEYYGDDRENFRKFARNDFENAVEDVMGDLRQVKRYIDDEDNQTETAPTTPEEAAEYYKQLKDARRAYEKVQAKNLLTPHDEMQVGRLLRGEILPEHLDPEKDFIKGITAVYEAKKEYDRLCKLLAEYKRTVRAEYRDKADQHLETANEWKDKKIGLAYSRETMERNIDDIVPDKEVAKAIKREYFEAVHASEAEATRFKTEFRNRVRGLNLSTKIKKGNLVSEAHAVQLLGEAEDNIRVLQKAKGRMKMRDGKTLEEWRSVIAELWKENPGLDEKKIRSAVEEYRKIYDELFEKMNDVRIRNGYEPVNYRQGYFPHFQPGEGDGILGAFGKALNIDTQVAALPTTINGLTHTFKPGIQWFGNAQERLGFNTAYDAIEGFDKYIEGVASLIYQTENIQKLRALAGQIRYRTSEDGIRRQVDEIRARDNLSEEEKQVQINSIYEHGRYTLSNFVNELDEYTNLLANKKSKLDRTMEAMMGRKAYTVMKAWEARVGANMIAGNLSSALTNFIPLTQAGAQLDKFSLIKGMAATLKAYKEDDGLTGMSAFLTNRRGSDPLVQTWVQKASKAMGTPMELVDGFTADSIVRAAYFQNLKRGLSEAEAMHQADVFASHVMADRSKGAMPTLFESKNPIFKAFTQFQLEVNNQFSEVFKDLPRGHREKGLAALTLVLLKYFLGAFLYNEVYEYFVGRRPALDPFGILNDTVGDLTGYELPNLVEWGTNAIKGEETSFQTEKVGIGEAGTNLAGTLMGELPFSSGLTLVGIETDGGRIPASSAVPDLTALWDAATTEGWSAEKRWKEAQDELNKLAYVIPPFGGNQIGKLWKGIKAFAEGGSYSVDAEGNDILQYPVYKDDPTDAFWNAARMGIFGKSALPEAQDWVDNGFNSLGAKQTAAYQDMVAAGVDDRDAYALIQQMEATQEKAAKYWILDDSNISQEGKTIVYYGLLASDSERELMDSLADAGAEQSEIGTLMMELKKASRLKGNEKREAQQNALVGASMTDEEKALVVGSILGTELTTESGKPTTYANFLTATSRGLGVDDFMDMRSKGVDVEDYLELTDSGINSSAALKLTYDMYELEERDDTENADYWRLAVKSSDNEAVQLSLLAGRMSDAMFEKASMAYELDISPDMFVTYYEKRSEYDADGNGSYTQAEVKSVIDAMGKGYTNEQKGILWQMATGSKSTKNNPYSKSAGQKWLDAKAAAKEKQE